MPAGGGGGRGGGTVELKRRGTEHGRKERWMDRLRALSGRAADMANVSGSEDNFNFLTKYTATVTRRLTTANERTPDHVTRRDCRTIFIIIHEIRSYRRNPRTSTTTPLTRLSVIRHMLRCLDYKGKDLRKSLLQSHDVTISQPRFFGAAFC